jgi:endonuclease/exonuclease/phosphatase (EEP) superfamily protein YafD
LLDVHPKGPPQGMRRHDASVDSVINLARSLPEPRVVAGDFNASPYNRTIQRVMDLGLDSAHERRGRGLATTWPNGEKPFTPVRLDHVFVDHDVAVLSVRELAGTGSDHKPVLTELAFDEVRRQTIASTMTTNAEVAANTSTAGRIQPRSRMSCARRPT